MIDKKNIIVSTDKNRLDVKLIHDFLTQSYWAKGRTLEKVKKTIENSICFGIYLKNEQIGFARVVTDTTIFANLMDVFILEKYRGNGFSKILLSEIFIHPELKNISKWFLATRDAHNLYKQFDFKEITKPKRFMERLINAN